MTKTEAMTKMKEKGADDALNLRGRASTMDGTAIIAEESKVPDFDAQKDYSACPAGTPVADEGQVDAYTAVQRRELSGQTVNAPRSVGAVPHERPCKG